MLARFLPEPDTITLDEYRRRFLASAPTPPSSPPPVPCLTCDGRFHPGRHDRWHYGTAVTA
jgi:hypothetical protein